MVGTLVQFEVSVNGHPLQAVATRPTPQPSLTPEGIWAQGIRARPRGRVEEVPGPQASLLVLDEQRALPCKHEERSWFDSAW